MPLDTSGFVTKEQDFGGLYKLSNNLEQKRLRDEEQQRQQQSKRTASDKYFTNYLDPKDRYTGTKFDPELNKLLGTALKQAYDLSSKGVSDTEIFTAISPLVNKVNDYSLKAQTVTAQKKQAMELLKGQKGINVQKFSDEFDDEVFNETDENGNKKSRDFSMIDPNFNYADKVMRERDIYNADGFDDYVSKAGKNTVVEDISVYNKDKSMRRTKAEITAPSFMVSDKDERGAHMGFVPKFDIAMDGEQPILHDFLKSEGVTETAPVRVVTEDVFNDLPPNTKAYLRQEARTYAKAKGIDPSSPQAENFAKALAYDELKRSSKQHSNFKEIQVQKEAPAPRITINNNSGGGDKGAAKADANKWLTDTDAAIKAKDINLINEQFRILERGGRFVDVNAKYDKDGNIVLTYLTPVTDGDNKLISRTFKNDANLANQLKGVYQSMTGEDKVFEYSKTDTPKPAASNTLNASQRRKN